MAGRKLVFRALALLVLCLTTGSAAAPLAPGKYRFALGPSRSCDDGPGSLSAPRCGAGIELGLAKTTGASYLEWTVTPVEGGNSIEGVRVTLRAEDRTGCATFATFRPAGCANAGKVQLRKLNAVGADRQQWVLLLQADGSFLVSPATCPRAFLGFRDACGDASARLLRANVGATTWTLSPVSNQQSDPSDNVAPGVAVAFSKTSDWGTAYDGLLSITNSNDFAITNWYLLYDFDISLFTWQSDFTLSQSGNQVKAVPNSYIMNIAAGATFQSTFGGRGALPANPRFVQLAPKPGLSGDPLAARGIFPNKFFSPYIDILHWPTPQLQDTIDSVGQLWYTLAFITSMGTRPAWGGVIDVKDQFFADQIRSLRLQHGDVIVSFGGANGDELAEVITDVGALAAAYQEVVDTYNLKWVDFDIEGSSITHTAAVDRRNAALKILQDKNPGLTISYCLPVLPVGLTSYGVALLANAVSHGLRVDVVQVMSMDYGDAAAPNPEGRMGAYAIQSAQSTYAQALSAGITNPRIGVIPMIGVNDVESEVFRLNDACQLANFAAGTDWMRVTSFWSVNRDQPGSNGAAPDSSGIAQERYDFMRMMQNPTCPTSAVTTVPVATRTGGSDAALPQVDKSAYKHNWQGWTQQWPGLGKPGK